MKLINYSSISWFMSSWWVFDHWLMSGCQSVSPFVSISDRSRFVRQQLTDLVDESFQRSIQSRPGGGGGGGRKQKDVILNCW